jgi:glyoxylase-like metal-dependent hydrolase (beta-lactamase superfamily II)
MLPSTMRFIERDWLSSNQIVFLDGSHQASLVDTGYVKHKVLSQTLVDHARTERSLTRIINTHLHSDHCGGNRLLADAHGCEVFVPEASYAAAAAWDTSRLSFEATGQRCDRFTPSQAIAPGQTLQLGAMPWHVYAAPGHDPESIILFQEDTGVLISADALWGDGFGVIFPELMGERGFDEQEAILKVITRLRPRCVIPGHGPIFSDVEEALQRAEARLTFLRSQPQKHAQYALKVLIKFLMLDRETENTEAFVKHLAKAKVAQDACALLDVDVHQGLRSSIESMVAAGQLFLTEDQGTLSAYSLQSKH